MLTSSSPDTVMPVRFPRLPTALQEVTDDLRRTAEGIRAAVARTMPGKPDTVPHPAGVAALAAMAPVNPNNCGLHTLSARAAGLRPSSLWQPTRDLEVELVGMMADLFHMPAEAVDGYVASGATEGNIGGLWMARNALRARVDGDTAGAPIAVLAGLPSHYSIAKACDVLGLGEGRRVVCPRCGDAHLFEPAADGSGLHLLDCSSAGSDASVAGLALDPDDVAATLRRLAARGVRRAIVVATLGATVPGTVDPVEAVCRAVRQVSVETGLRAMVHVDAAFGGLVLPFLGDGSGAEWSRWPEVSSVTVDFHKMGMAPYGAGLLLFRRGMTAGVARPVGYIGIGTDATLLGSRPGASAAAAWAVVRTLGRPGFARRARHGMGLARRLADRLADARGVTALAGAGVNVAPLRVSADDPTAAAAIRAVLAGHHIRGERLPLTRGACPDEVFPVYLMPHVRGRAVDRFADELLAAAAAGAQQSASTAGRRPETTFS